VTVATLVAWGGDGLSVSAVAVSVVTGGAFEVAVWTMGFFEGAEGLGFTTACYSWPGDVERKLFS